MRGLIASSVSVLFVAACFVGGSSTNDNPDGSTANVTYYKDVAPIIQNHCQSCHVPGGIGAFPLLTYDDAHANSDDIVYETGARNMPPWGARTTNECTPRFGWKNDPTLSDAEIATLASWHTGGDVAGDPKDAPPPSTTPPLTDLPNSTSLAPTTPFSLSGQADYFRCFVLDPQITQKEYITGTFVKPGNTTIVHHALLFSVPAGATIPPPDDPNVPNQYTCFGSANVTGQQLMAVWTPGGQPFAYPPDVGQPVEAGTKFIMQIHYHPHANATTDPDTSTFEYTATTTQPTWGVLPELVGNFKTAVNAKGIGLMNPPFTIPPNTPSTQFTMQYTEPTSIPIPLKILAVAAHMHLVGVDEKISLHRANGTADQPTDECMLQVPSWDFNWQRAYQYNTDISTLPTIAPGDVAQIRCTYDNTLQNPWVAQALSEQGLTQTQTVTLGETTLDEMCLGAFWLVAPAALLP
jgi:mono/diheme cytochrome c family protein